LFSRKRVTQALAVFVQGVGAKIEAVEKKIAQKHEAMCGAMLRALLF